MRNPATLTTIPVFKTEIVPLLWKFRLARWNSGIHNRIVTSQFKEEGRLPVGSAAHQDSEQTNERV